MIARAFYSDAVASAKNSSDTWYSAEMRVLENEGVYRFKDILSGQTLTLIEDPNVGLSRYKMAKMMANIIDGTVEIDVNAATAKVSDAMMSPYYGISVVLCVNAGLLNGYDDGKFHGEDTLTRAQATAVINRLYNLMNVNEQPAEATPEAEPEKKEEAPAAGNVATSTDIALPDGFEDMTLSDLGGEKYAEAIRVELTKLINEHRVANGLDACEEWGVLVTGATARSKEIVQKFAHGRPDGRSTATLYEELFLTDVVPSENIAKGGIPGAGTASSQANYIFNAWKESAGHNETMLGRTFEYIGVGVYYQNAMTYAVTHFVVGVQYDEICSEFPEMAVV